MPHPRAACRGTRAAVGGALLLLRHQVSKRPKIQIEILVLQAERRLQFVHFLLEPEQGFAQSFYFVLAERTRLDPSDSLLFQQPSDKLDQGQDKLRQTLFHRVWVRVDPSREGRPT